MSTSSAGSGRRGSASAFETVAGDMHLGDRAPHAGASATDRGGKKQKICCACGKDVAHEERYKDRNGHYWCMDCGVQEHRSKHKLSHPADTAPCADCSETFEPSKRIEHDNLKLCPGCIEKRLKAAEREAARQAARKAAIAQEIIDSDRRRRQMLIIGTVVAAVVVAAAAYMILF
jgi:hypothetical protein